QFFFVGFVLHGCLHLRSLLHKLAEHTNNRCVIHANRRKNIVSTTLKKFSLELIELSKTRWCGRSRINLIQLREYFLDTLEVCFFSCKVSLKTSFFCLLPVKKIRFQLNTICRHLQTLCFHVPCDLGTV